MEEKDEKFSDDPMEHYKIENEILKLKLKAQFGDAFQLFTEGEAIPADVENQFLKNMIAFEENFQNAEFETIGNKLGNPVYEPYELLSPIDVKKTIEDVNTLLDKHSIKVDFLYKDYSDETVYSFLTQDLMDKEIEKNLPEGATCNFIYEEFYPNHREDITNLTHQFVLGWVTKNIAEVKQHLTKELIDTEGQRYTETAVVKKITNFFEAFDKFQNDGYNLDDVNYTLTEDNDNEYGMGHGEGSLTFEAVMENGEVIKYQGPYKVYCSYIYGYWHVVSFVMPGFSWK